MKRPAQAPRSARDIERQVKGFIAKFERQHQTLIRAVRRALRKRLPGAFELVYDTYNCLVIGYGATARPSEGILSLAADANGVTLFFLYGVGLPDPKKILLGDGKQVRSIRLPAAATLKRPEVEAILAAAVARSRHPLRGGKTEVSIRLISKKQRPRRKPAQTRSPR
ncbi:MAG: hypothetical protein ACHQXA_11320 [Gemmatimonadales bacterium]